jgi:hypothetical protein
MTCTRPHEDPEWEKGGGIPEFLCRECHPELATQGSAARPVTVTVSAPKEDWQLRNERAAQARLADRKAKNAASLAKLKEKRAGQKYDRKNKVWVADAADGC